jgi:hypothetical protein
MSDAFAAAVIVDLHIALFLSEFRQIEVTIVGGASMTAASPVLVSLVGKCCVVSIPISLL